MFLDWKNDIELEGSNENAIEATISKENLPFIIDLITRQQYRNPIGSIVREITSNCFDACVEAGVNDPVTIKFSTDDLGDYISFEDKGIGMSPDRIKNVYLSYGESTKRHTKNEIGGFGLGGKSPLAYTDHFYVTTRFDGIEYEYILHKGKTLPTIELIASTSTTKRNGTIIKIYLKTNEDRWDFIEECKKQLSYFDNVYFYNTVLFKNEYNILEGKHFKLRTGEKYSDTLHLCIGKVAYPIDWDAIKRKHISIPIALKFEINDLIVTPERESIRYVDVNGVSTEEIICRKLDMAIAELKELYYKQDLSVGFLTYLNNDNSRATLKIDEEYLDVSSIIKENRIFYPELKEFIGTIDENVFKAYTFHYDTYNRTGKNFKDIQRVLELDRLTAPEYDIYVNNGGKQDVHKNRYLYSILPYNKKGFHVAKINFTNYETLSKYVEFNENPLNHGTSKVKQLVLLRKVLDNIINNYTKNYNSLELSLSAANFKKRNQEAKIKKSEDEIVVYNHAIDLVSKRKQYAKIDQLQHFTGFIIYGFKEDVELLDNWASLLNGGRYGKPSLKISKACKVIMISGINEKHLIKSRAFYVKQFIGDNKVFRHLATALYLSDIYTTDFLNSIIIKDDSENELELNNSLHLINFEIYNIVQELTAFSTEYIEKAERINTRFKESIINLAKEQNLLDQDVIEKYEKLVNYFKPIKLINNVNITQDNFPLIIDFFNSKNREINNYYFHNDTFVNDCIKESLQKIQYFLEVKQEPQKTRYSYQYRTQEDALLAGRFTEFRESLKEFNITLNTIKLCRMN